jgi:pimeloyl-ACP methyl ester carboxylesterase
MSRRLLLRVLAGLAAALVVLAVGTWQRPVVVLSAVRKAVLWRRGVEQRDVIVGGHRIHYLVVGEGPPLVLVPGLAMSAEDWSPLLRELSTGHRTYALDLLGYGGSDRPLDADYSVRQQAVVLRGFLDALALRSPDLLGISMGGWIALHLAAEHPERVGRLVLVSSGGFDFETDIREDTFTPDTVGELRAMVALQTDRPFAVPDFIARDLVRTSQRSAWVVQRGTRSLLSRRDVLEGRLGRVRMPVLLVSGTADRLVPHDVALRMQREMPHAELVELEGCGHQALLDCRRQALPPILRFLGAG